MLYCTYRRIADRSGISYATVAATMKKLREVDFLRRGGAGKYMANLICFGGKNYYVCFISCF